LAQPATTPPRGKHIHYRALDGFRGLAILLVFIFHAFHTTHQKSRPMQVASWIGGGGWMGVDVFFVLSGFLITGILIDSVHRPRYFRNFYIRRALRIFPLFYGVLLLLLLLTPVLHSEWHLGHLALLVYAQNIAVNLNPGLGDLRPAVTLTHFWSLAVEEQYYLIWPLTILVIRDPRKIMRLCLVLMAASLALRVGLLAFGVIGPGRDWNWIYMELPTHLDGLVLGSWLALATRHWSTPVLLRHTRWPFWLAIAVLAGILVQARTADYATDAMSSVGFTAIAVIFAGLLLRCFVPGSAATRFFDTAFLRFLGRYSYGIYVYHRLFNPLMTPVLYWLEARLHSRAAGSLVYLALWFTSSIGVAVFSYRFFESPFLRLKDRLAPTSPADPAVTEGALMEPTRV
jgi:peptidoglycan/LPS O-acetylase OafA/YrhL